MNIIGFMVMVLVIIMMYFFRFYSNTIPEEIMNIDWYHYNINNGYYEKIIFNSDKIKYYRPSNIKDLNEYDICSKYSFNKKTNQIKMDCNKNIKLVKNNIDNILLNIDGKSYSFFKNVDESINYEFKNYYQKSIIEYKKEKDQVKELVQINEKKLFEVIKQDEYSKIVFIGDKCSSVDCVLALDIMEKWVSKAENIYYYDVNALNSNTISNINKIDKLLLNDIDFYNNIYPRVIITKNNKMIDTYEIKCNGFNCSTYFNNEF